MKRAALPCLLLAFAGCSPRMMDIRPFVAHPDQKLEDDVVLVSTQGRVRAAVRYMQPAELDEAFRLPGKVGGTANPFLYRPPLAPAKFTVFKINVRNESEYDTFVEFNKILLRDDTGGEHRPLGQQKLTDYWIGRVTVQLGKPVTWTAQMEAVSRKEEKEKSLVKTIYEGGRIPSRGEHTGYLVFNDLPADIKAVQLLVEIVTRASRYGNPLSLALMEFNFSRLKVPVPPKETERTYQ